MRNPFKPNELLWTISPGSPMTLVDRPFTTLISDKQMRNGNWWQGRFGYWIVGPIPYARLYLVARDPMWAIWMVARFLRTTAYRLRRWVGEKQ